MSNYAPIRHDIWQNDAFVALTPEAKLLYLLLATHRKLTRCGCLDLMPSRWAKATGLTVTTVERCIAELAGTRMVVVDDETDELIVRSKVKHDPPNTWTQVKAVWNTWETVESATLREWLAWSFPEVCYSTEKVAPLTDRPTHSPTDSQSDRQCHSQSDSHTDSQGRAIAPSTMHRAPAPLAPTLSTRERDLLWDALLEACRLDPAELTKSARGAANRARSDLAAVGATPAEVRARAANYRARFPDAALTPTALAKQWAQVARPPEKRTKGDDINDRILKAVGGLDQ